MPKDFKKYYIIKAAPSEVYMALTNQKSLELWTDDAAEMTTEPGSEFSLWGGSILGKNLEYFYPTPYASVLGNNERTYRKVKPDTCARKCLEERDFVCRSFDYQVSHLYLLNASVKKKFVNVCQLKNYFTKDLAKA